MGSVRNTARKMNSCAITQATTALGRRRRTAADERLRHAARHGAATIADIRKLRRIARRKLARDSTGPDEREVLRKHLLELFTICPPDLPELADARRQLAALLY